MRAVSILLLCVLTLTGCLSSDISRSQEFRSHLVGGLKTQRVCYAYKSEHMKSVMFGGWVEVWRITDDRPSIPAVIIPVGTPVRITRIERRNLIDHGTEIVAFGVVRIPNTGTETEFLYELTVGLGERIRRAPWQDQSVPEFRSAQKKQPNKRTTAQRASRVADR